MNDVSPSGRVDKVIQIIAASSQSWEHAAQNAVAEAANSIRDLTVARVLERDMVIVDDALTYRVKLELAFRVDRTRIDAAGVEVQVKRYLVLANHTLVNPAVLGFVTDVVAGGGAEVHVVVPRSAPSVLHADPATGLIGPAAHTMVAESREASRRDGESRLATFQAALRDQASLADAADAVTGEVMLTDPMTAIRTVMARSSFDEIVISTLQAGVSKWLKMDLPSRVEQAFSLPVTKIEHSG